MVGTPGLEPGRPIKPTDFKSVVFTNFTMPPIKALTLGLWITSLLYTTLLRCVKQKYMYLFWYLQRMGPFRPCKTSKRLRKARAAFSGASGLSAMPSGVPRGFGKSLRASPSEKPASSVASR